VVSLILQATGGGMAASESKGSSGSVDTGNNIMIAGLAFQVFTLTIFIALAADFLIRVLRQRGSLRPMRHTGSHDRVFASGSWIAMWGFTGFHGILASLALSTICIFWRSCFRVAELSDGWTGTLMGRQDLFIGFEGVMISIACLVLNFWHPAYVLNGMEQRRQHYSDNSLERISTSDVCKEPTRGQDFEMTSTTSVV
jgi:hypothetical protein